MQKAFTPTPIPTKSGLVWGFTLLEVLLVVVIVAIIVSVVTPRFRKSLTTIQLANTTQDIAQLMRFLKAKAYTEKVNYQLKFNVAGKKYLSQQISGGKPVQFSESRSIPDGVNIATTVNPIIFYSDGTIDDVKIYLFKGKGEFYKDLGKAINKEFDLGQIQTVTQTEYIYTITTQPSIGRIKVVPPEE